MFEGVRKKQFEKHHSAQQSFCRGLFFGVFLCHVLMWLDWVDLYFLEVVLDVWHAWFLYFGEAPFVSIFLRMICAFPCWTFSVRMRKAKFKHVIACGSNGEKNLWHFWTLASIGGGNLLFNLFQRALTWWFLMICVLYLVVGNHFGLFRLLFCSALGATLLDWLVFCRPPFSTKSPVSTSTRN